MRGYVAELLAKAIDRGALDAELTPDDKERVRGMLTSFGGLADDRSYAGSNRAGYRGTAVRAGMAAGEIEETLDFGELLGSEFWEYKLHFSHFLDQNPTLFQPVGGMDAIVRAFAERAGHLVQYECVVEQVRRQGDGVRIVYRGPDGAERSALADHAICTIPAPVLKDIPNDFSAATQAALGSLEFVEAVKVAFQARRRFWEEDSAIYGGISWTDNDITQVWYPCNGYHRSKGVLVGAYIWSREPGLRYSAMSAPERLRAALAKGEPLHPAYAGEMECGISRAWLNVPFQKGSWLPSARAPTPYRIPTPDVHRRWRDAGGDRGSRSTWRGSSASVSSATWTRWTSTTRSWTTLPPRLPRRAASSSSRSCSPLRRSAPRETRRRPARRIAGPGGPGRVGRARYLPQ